MAGIDLPQMRDEFAGWYGAVTLGDDHKILRARWKGVSTIVSTADSDMIEVLLRLVHRSRQPPAPDLVEAIRSAFRSADAAFEMSGNDRELRTLAASCLAVLMRTSEHIGAVAALATTTAGFGSVRRPNLPMDLSALGEKAIVRLADTNSVRPSFEPYMKVPRFDLNLQKAVTEYNNGDIDASFKIIAEKVRSAIKMVADTQASAVREIARFLSVQDEELQILGWLTSQQSRVLDCAFADIPGAVRPLVLASELADQTAFLPGPPSVRGILSRAGLKEHESVRVVDAVDAADPDWLRGLVADVDPSFVSTPLHAAIEQQLETGRGTAWVAGWAENTEVSGDYAMSGLSLGNLFYRERLLCLHSE